jgi:hypothetical protein
MAPSARRRRRRREWRRRRLGRKQCSGLSSQERMLP